MVGTSVSVLSGGDLEMWSAIASLTALMIFVLCLLSYYLRLSSLVSFISESILLGFKAGAALTIISTQLPKLANIHTDSGNFFMCIYSFCENAGEANGFVLMFGLIAFAVLFLGEKFFPGRPVSLIVVVSSILIAHLRINF